MALEFSQIPSALLIERGTGPEDRPDIHAAARPMGRWFGDETLKARVTVRGAVAVIEVRGSAEGEAVATLNSALDLACACECPTVAVVLRHVTWVDSEGFGALILAQKRLVEQERRLLVCGPSQPVREALRLTRLDVLLPVVRSLRDLNGPT